MGLNPLDHWVGEIISQKKFFPGRGIGGIR